MEKFKFIEKNNEKLPKVLVSLIFTIGFYYILSDAFHWNLNSFKDAFVEDVRLLNPVTSFAACWNQLADSLGISNFIILKHLNGEGITAPFTLMVLAAFFIVTLMLLSGKNNRILYVYLVVPLFLVLITKLNVSLIGVGFMVIAVISTAALNKMGAQAVSGAIALSITVVAITVSLVNTNVGADYILGDKWIKSSRAAVSRTISNIYYGKEALGGGDILLRKRPDLDGKAIEVTGENLKPMYLRGFIGSRIDDNKWVQYDDSFYYRNHTLMSRLQEGGFDGLGQLGQSSMFALGEKHQNPMFFKLYDASKAHAYLPYEMTDQGSLISYTSKGDTQIYHGFIKRMPSYQIRAVKPVTNCWTKVGAKLLTLPEKEQIETGYGTCNLSQYKINESYYNKYVYDSFTSISSADKDAVAEALSIEAGTYVALGYKGAIEKVKNFMDKEMTYTNKLAESMGQANNKGENKSAVVQILKSKEGFDVQYATLATVMFRYLGIPARYVEGYLLTEDDIRNDKAVINQEKAHSWTEIYVDGVGFVPVETCSEFYGLMEEVDLSVGVSNGTLNANSNSGSNSNENSEENDVTDGGSGGSAINWLKYFVFTICSAIAVFLIWKLLRWVFVLASEYLLFRKLLKGKDNKIAVQAAFQKMTDKNYPISEDGMMVGNKASYSNEIVTDDERALLMGEFKNGRKNLRSMKKEEGVSEDKI